MTEMATFTNILLPNAPRSPYIPAPSGHSTYDSSLFTTLPQLQASKNRISDVTHTISTKISQMPWHKPTRKSATSNRRYLDLNTAGFKVA